MSDNQQINQLLNFVQNNDWIVQVFLIVLISLTLSFVARRAINKIEIKLQKTKNPWDDLLTQSLQKPVAWLIWLLGLTFAADVVHEQSGAAIFEAVGPVRDIGVI
ncbi:MAG: mechanosensitive ion channel family protein, partial [Gammaproteobacteria bacterium]